MLNVFILAAELGGLLLRGADDAPYALNLKTARPFLPSAHRLRPDCLYLVGQDQLEAALGWADEVALALVGGTAPQTWGRRRSLLVLDAPEGQGDALSDALDRVLATFERYDALEAAMGHDAIAGTSAQAVLKHSAKVLANPIVLSDAALGFIARTDDCYPKASDSVWDAVGADGYFADEALPADLVQRAEQSHVPTFYELGSVRTLQSCIRLDGEPVGFIGSTELYAPFTDDEVAKVCWLNEALAGIWPLIIQSVHRWSEVEQVIIRTIDGEPVNEALVSRVLARLSWAPADSYRMLSFYRNKGHLDHKTANQVHGALKREFPTGFVLSLDDEVLVILHGAHARDEIGTTYLERLMEKHGLCCALSMVQNSFGAMGAAYEQCSIVRAVSETARPSPGAFIAIGAVLPSYLLQLIAAAQDPEVLCHPQVAALMQRGHGPEFVHSLRLYIANGRSMSRAARALYVHRSSLTYRIEQIERVLGFSLDEADEATLVHLYLSCLIVENRAGQGLPTV